MHASRFTWTVEHTPGVACLFIDEVQIDAYCCFAPKKPVEQRMGLADVAGAASDRGLLAQAFFPAL
jgi:hypothetical protein